MAKLLHDLITNAAWKHPERCAVRCLGASLDFGQLALGVEQAAQALLSLGLKGGERVAVLLDKRAETLLAMFGALTAGATFVPIDPQLSDDQVALVLQGSGACMLVTTPARRLALADTLARCPNLRCVLQLGLSGAAVPGLAVFGWDDCLAHAAPLAAARALETAPAALVYACGASGKPRAAMLSHRALLACAASLSERLGERAQQRNLCLLPLSGAPGLGLLASGLGCAGATLLVNHVLARDMPALVGRENVTAAAAPPWLWMQAGALDWRASQGLRAMISASGTLPRPTLDALKKRLPMAQVMLLHERRDDDSGAGAALVPHPGAGAEQLATVS